MTTKIDYEEWYELNEEKLWVKWMESGASGELDNDFDSFCEDTFEKEIL